MTNRDNELTHQEPRKAGEPQDMTSICWKISDAYDIGLAEELPVLDLSPRRLFEELESRGYRYAGERWVFFPGEAKVKQ